MQEKNKTSVSFAPRVQFVNTVGSGMDVFWIGTEAANLGIWKTWNLKNCTFSPLGSV